MQAAYVEQLGPADNICHGELPDPVPGASEVLVRVAATAVNPVDTFVRSGAYPTPTPFPFVIGRDLVGTVVDPGPGNGFSAGETVWCNSMGHAGRQGAAAEYAAVPTERLYRLPDGVGPETAVALAHPTATAYLALHTHGRLAAGETVYVGGGAGHVGGAATVLAVRAGARVVVSASVEDESYCRGLGADEVLDYRDPDLAGHLRAAAPEGVDLHLETSGHHDLTIAVDVLSPRGRVVLMSGIAARPTLPAGALYTRDRCVLGFAISNATVPELAAAAARLNQLLVAGALAPRQVEVLPLAEAARAHQLLESGAARGRRLLLRP